MGGRGARLRPDAGRRQIFPFDDTQRGCDNRWLPDGLGLQPRGASRQRSRLRRSIRSRRRVSGILIDELEEEFIIVVVTHRMQRAVRSSDYTACMYLGEMVEFDVTDELFVKPNKKETEDDITGRCGRATIPGGRVRAPRCARLGCIAGDRPQAV